MGIFSFFQKPKPDEAARSIAEKFVIASLFYAKEVKHDNNQQSANAGAEVAYLLLHLLDREIFAQLSKSRRGVFFDSISQNVIASYSKAVLRPETPPNLLFETAKQMQDTLNSRQITYSRCRSLLGEPFPGIGSMAFAFCFFVRRALGQPTRMDADDILAGEKNISDADEANFPNAETAYRGAEWIGATLKTLRMQDEVKYLR